MLTTQCTRTLEEKAPDAVIIAEVTSRFVPLSKAHELLGYHEQYARRIILAHALPGRDIFTLWGRTLVSIAFVHHLMNNRASC